MKYSFKGNYDMDKINLRQEMRLLRKNILAKEVYAFGEKLLLNLQELVARHNKIAIYHACHGEISLEPFIKYGLSHNKEIYRPVALRTSKMLKFERVVDLMDRDIFVDEGYKLFDEIKCYNLDLVIVPLLAVDKSGHRLGQGGGYYDSTFGKLTPRPIMCGVGYEWQLRDVIPSDEWDVPLDYFVSDQHIYKFTG